MLLALDQPLVVYDNDKKQKHEVTSLDVLKARQKWEQAEKERGGKPIVLDFSNFGNNKKD